VRLLVLIGALAGGHVFLEDVCWVAEALVARWRARVFGFETSRLRSCRPM
jgi:hypothetical protein